MRQTGEAGSHGKNPTCEARESPVQSWTVYTRHGREGNIHHAVIDFPGGYC